MSSMAKIGNTLCLHKLYLRIECNLLQFSWHVKALNEAYFVLSLHITNIQPVSTITILSLKITKNTYIIKHN